MTEIEKTEVESSPQKPRGKLDYRKVMCKKCRQTWNTLYINGKPWRLECMECKGSEVWEEPFPKVNPKLPKLRPIPKEPKLLLPPNARCSVKGCNCPRYSKGRCHRHYDLLSGKITKPRRR
jgi:hypothetical protein